MELSKVFNLEWVAAQAGIPVSFLIGIPIFVTVVFMLSSMLATKEPENYKLGKQSQIRTGNTWLAPLGILVLVGLVLAGFSEKLIPN